METLVCGAPLISSDCIGLREVVKDTPAAVFTSGNSQELADLIIAEMTTDRSQIFRAFQESAATRFDVKNQADQLKAVYRSMTKRKLPQIEDTLN